MQYHDLPYIADSLHLNYEFECINVANHRYTHTRKSYWTYQAENTAIKF